MTLRSHPSQVLLADYASGALPTAPGLTVSAHLGFCSDCAARVDQLVEAGGEMLTALPDAPLSPGALGATLARLDAPVSVAVAAPAIFPGMDLPAAVQAAGVGPRRWFGRGAWVAHTKASTAHGWRAFLLALPPRGRLPSHGHGGMELTTVLKGTFTDDSGVHRRGDFVAVDHHVMHDVVVGGDGPCVCLVSTQGPLVWRNPWLGVMRSLTGI